MRTYTYTPILENVTGKKLVVVLYTTADKRINNNNKNTVLQMIPRQLSPRNDEGV